MNTIQIYFKSITKFKLGFFLNHYAFALLTTVLIH